MFLWLPHVGDGKNTLAPGRNFATNAAPTRRLPVPDKDCTVATLPSRTASLSLPSSKSTVAALNSAKPCIGKYSLSWPASNIIFSARLTTSSTYGLSSSVRYAPTPRLSLLGFWHSRNATETPRMGSGGACSTSDRKDSPARDTSVSFREIGRRDRRVLGVTRKRGETTREAREAAMLSIGSKVPTRCCARFLSVGVARRARPLVPWGVANRECDAPSRHHPKNPASGVSFPRESERRC